MAQIKQHNLSLEEYPLPPIFAAERWLSGLKRRSCSQNAVQKPLTQKVRGVRIINMITLKCDFFYVLLHIYFKERNLRRLLFRALQRPPEKNCKSQRRKSKVNKT